MGWKFESPETCIVNFISINSVHVGWNHSNWHQPEENAN